MRAWLDIAEGPMFRFAFVVMAAGLARLVVISIRDILRMRARTPDKSVNVLAMMGEGLHWLNPLRWMMDTRPWYSATSFLFHVGLILVPIFFLPHVTLWREGIGFGWPSLASSWADALTLLTIATGLALVGLRAADEGSRTMSHMQDWLLTPLCVLVFATGFLAAHPASSPFSYNAVRLVHVLAGDAVLLLMPFTKLAHVVLLPFTRALTEMSWRFVPGVGAKVREALGHPDRPV